MRIVLTVLAFAAFGAVAGQSALAADLPVKAPRLAAAPVPYADWSGVYVGIEGGYGWGKQDADAKFPFNDHFPCDREKYDCRDFRDALRDVGPIDFPNGSISATKQRGWLAGGFVGAQKQWGNWVLGIEADFDAADIKKSGVSSTVLNLQPDNPNERLQFTHDVAFASKIDELGSIRGKVGFVPTPNLLLYGTGGLAFAHVANTLTDTQTTNYFDVKDLANGDSDAIKFYQKNSTTTSGGGTMLGWAAGAGADWKFAMDQGSSWVLGVQYLHYQFPKNAIMLSDNAAVTTSFNSTQSVDAIKGRLSYLFSIH
jgi:outer membrane immunogenic protein